MGWLEEHTSRKAHQSPEAKSRRLELAKHKRIHGGNLVQSAIKHAEQQLKEKHDGGYAQG